MDGEDVCPYYIASGWVKTFWLVKSQAKLRVSLFKLFPGFRLSFMTIWWIYLGLDKTNIEITLPFSLVWERKGLFSYVHKGITDWVSLNPRFEMAFCIYCNIYQKNNLQKQWKPVQKMWRKTTGGCCVRQTLPLMLCWFAVVSSRDGQWAARDGIDARSSWGWPGEDGRNCAGPWGKEEIGRVSIWPAVEINHDKRSFEI